MKFNDKEESYAPINDSSRLWSTLASTLSNPNQVVSQSDVMSLHNLGPSFRTALPHEKRMIHTHSPAVGNAGQMCIIITAFRLCIPCSGPVPHQVGIVVGIKLLDFTHPVVFSRLALSSGFLGLRRSPIIVYVQDSLPPAQPYRRFVPRMLVSG